ncbi:MULTISPECIES: DUF3288 family protein [unclassified Roseofilum]|uniref:DUF3288 family protein n=1 Tax=unclassified Roseofilum TaxID=2620099 RepID=UPI000E810746|nr:MULTISPECIES: DUF3288 family protein [unclassified Roseofilum]MBP0008038.1 DUF3288 family protein [Roseofilum sp. Belize Diploria]MBP0031677.1 DUF3288 family protein [Roseofilum sp. Belize BBD 4]HBQ99745.1 DUF3288 domain-containing protein [Cyanobacteria bacterium UBA11691]
MDRESGKDQKHPREDRDRLIVDQLLQHSGEPTDFHLVELARLRIRYQDFPGARALQQDLNRAMQQWNLNEEALFERTRTIHIQGLVYKRGGNQQEDWS